VVLRLEEPDHSACKNGGTVRFESETVLFDDIRGSGFYNYGRKVADISGDYVLKVKG